MMKIYSSLIFISLLLLISCNGISGIEDNTQETLSDSRESVWMDSLCSRLFAGRKAGTSGNYIAYQFLVSETKKMGYSPQTMEFTHNDGTLLRNVIVTVKGEIEDSLFIVGAHFDGQNESNEASHYQAANDNGSGVVTALSFLDSLARIDKPRYTVIVGFWDGEEAIISPAFKGSTYFVNQIENTESVVLYVNMDAMGHSHNNTMLLGWYGGNNQSRVSRMASEIVEDNSFTYSLIERKKGVGTSDYYSFGKVGIPYISYTDGILDCDNRLHTVSDKKDAIDLSRLRSIRDITFNILNSY